MQTQHQKFWFVENQGKIPEIPGKISENVCKICENLRNIPENLSKLPENMCKNSAQRCLIWKDGVQHLQRSQEDHFWRSSQKGAYEFCGRKYSYKTFSGKFEEIGAKILRTPKNMLAPIPMLRLATANIGTDKGSGVGGREHESAPPKVLILWISGQNS